MDCKEYGQLNERIYSGKLQNGLSVFVVPKKGFHKKFAFFAANYGGIDKRFKYNNKWIDTPIGVAHFLEHKMFDTESGNALTMLSENGASPNAHTSTDITAYHFNCIDKFTENLKLLLSFVTVPYFTPEGVEKEQGIITQEIRMIEDDPDFCLYYGLLKSLYKYNPLREPIAGTVESISEITADTLQKCHKIFYNPSNMALCVVGDMDPNEVYNIAKDIVTAESGEIPERDYGKPELLIPEKTSIEKNMDVSLPIFLVGCKTNPAPHGRETLKHEIISALALEVLVGHSSPFYMRLYSDGLINADFTSSFNSVAGAAYTAIGGETRDPQRVYQEIVNEVHRLLQHGPDTALLKRIKKAIIGTHIRALNSFSAIASCVVEGYFHGYDSFEALDIISEVTENDITLFIKESLVPDNMAISVISPTE
jgi:predicted Zn-dependent peptidase